MPRGTYWTKIRAGGHTRVLLACSLYFSFLPRWPESLPSVNSCLSSLRKVCWFFVCFLVYFLISIFRWKMICKTRKPFISQGCFHLHVGVQSFAISIEYCQKHSFSSVWPYVILICWVISCYKTTNPHLSQSSFESVFIAQTFIHISSEYFLCTRLYPDWKWLETRQIQFWPL